MREKPVYNERLTGKGGSNILVLFNDDFNTFEHIIEALVEVCGHDPVQAEQCATIAHFNGSCEVKEGNIRMLSSMSKRLMRRDISTEVI